MNKESRALRYTAYHEAGHAVAAFRLNRSVRKLSIIPDETTGNLGLTQNTATKVDEDSNRFAAFAERQIVILFAGGAAEAKHRGQNDHKGANQDYQSAVELALKVCGSEEEAEKYLAWLKCCAKNMMANRELWQAVTALAEELLAKKEIKGAEAKRIFLPRWLRLA
jgi:hypothetical protein